METQRETKFRAKGELPKPPERAEEDAMDNKIDEHKEQKAFGRKGY